MLPVIIGGHTAYQNTFVSEFLKFYFATFVFSKDTWDIRSLEKGLVNPTQLSVAGDGTPVHTSSLL